MLGRNSRTVVSHDQSDAGLILARGDVHDGGHEAFGEGGEILAGETGAVDRLLLRGGLGHGGRRGSSGRFSDRTGSA